MLPPKMDRNYYFAKEKKIIIISFFFIQFMNDAAAPVVMHKRFAFSKKAATLVEKPGPFFPENVK